MFEINTRHDVKDTLKITLIYGKVDGKSRENHFSKNYVSLTTATISEENRLL